MKSMFMSIAAQEDNLGDIIIRRTVVNSFLERGYRIHLFSGNMPASYIRTFELPDNTPIYSSLLRFQSRLFYSCLVSKVAFVLAPGPVLLNDTMARVAKRMLVVSTLILVKGLGGDVYNIGRSIRGNGKFLNYLERIVVKLSSIYAVRDTKSLELMSGNVTLEPDIGLLEKGSSESTGRTYVVFSFRYDNPVSADALSELVAECNLRGHVPVFVSQVKRDDEQHIRLAKELSVKVVPWGDNDHSEQLFEIEKIYSHSHAIISNRLHALILGVVAGALPVDFGASDKILSTLSSIFPKMVSMEFGEELDYSFLDFHESEYLVLENNLIEARVRIGDLMSSI